MIKGAKFKAPFGSKLLSSAPPMTSLEIPPGTMTSPEIPPGMMTFPYESMAVLSMMKISDTMLVEIPDWVFAKTAQMLLSEMTTPAMFKMAPVGIIGIIVIRIIPIGGPGHHDIVASISEIIITAIESRCIIKFFFGPF